MPKPFFLNLQPVKNCIRHRGIEFAPEVKFGKILVVGPPGSGKSTICNRLGGWPQEGYIDLSYPSWWKTPHLAMRPREIHLGFPFVGRKKALAVFEQDWLTNWDRLELDFERIQIPPGKRFVLSVNWYARFNFEFLLPEPEKLLQARRRRAESGTHEIDQQLDLQQIQRQVETYAQVAKFIHDAGLIVCTRDGVEGTPSKIVERSERFGLMPQLNKAIHKSFLRQFQDLVEELDPCEDVDLKHNIQLNSKKIHISSPLLPLQIQLGVKDGKTLYLYPELKLNADGKFGNADSYLLFDPDRFFTRISGFIRLFVGDSLMLGRDDDEQNILLQYPKTVAKQHLKLKLPDNGLQLKDKSLERGTCVAPLSSSQEITNLEHWRCENIECFMRLFPDPLTPQHKDTALELINAVIECMHNDPHQPPDCDGKPGGVVQLSDEMNVFFIGDLHTKIDNLLVILTQNRFLKALEEGSASLIILGDAVHPDEEGKEAEMHSSILMMDFILRLKLKFPHQVHYLRGNHDSFSEDISKQGVSQGLLWKKALREERGSDYLHAMEQLYLILPYVAISKRFLACHAGAPTSKVSLSRLVDIRQHPKLQKQITSIRLQKPNRPDGYTSSDVKSLRKQLNLNPQTPFIVGHTPISDDDTLWWDVKKIANHHVLFGADRNWVGVIVCDGEHTYPLRYPTEPLSSFINQSAEES